MFFFIDKPLGITSYDVIRRLKKLLQTKRIGHAGTLDPLATGCLLIATDKSTKLLHLLEGSRKRYRFTVRIDGMTPSYDLGTEVSFFEKPVYHQHTQTELLEFLYRQTEQIPPLYSALHVNGKRAYELARSGSSHTLPARPIRVEDIIITSMDLPLIQVELTISSGGYIRSFAPLIGQFFGVEGGYITELRRISIFTQYGDLKEEQAIKLEHIIPSDYFSLAEVFPTIQQVSIDIQTFQDIKQGRILQSIPNITPKEGEKYFLSYKSQYLSLVEYTNSIYSIVRNDL